MLMSMLAEVNIAINKKSAQLVLRVGETVKDEETWTFPAISRTEAKNAAMILFSDAYDYLNACVHGDPDDQDDKEDNEQPPAAEA
jgi:hypothetical protein